MVTIALNATNPIKFHVHEVAFLSIEFSDELFLGDNLCHYFEYTDS